jgi:hypothetical protein
MASAIRRCSLPLLSALVASIAPMSASAALTMTSVMNDLACSVIPDPIPQGAPNPGGSILASGFRVYGRLTAATIADISGHAARTFDYQYVVQNAFIARGRPTFASNSTQTTYTGKVIVDAYNFQWKSSYYTAFYKVIDDPISSMQLDDAFYASRIIGGGIVGAVFYGSMWTLVVKGALANGEVRNVAVCSLPVTTPIVY